MMQRGTVNGKAAVVDLATRQYIPVTEGRTVDELYNGECHVRPIRGRETIIPLPLLRGDVVTVERKEERRKHEWE
jgi:hypothetical protein